MVGPGKESLFCVSLAPMVVSVLKHGCPWWSHWMVSLCSPGVILKPATITTKSGNPYMAVLISWFLVQVHDCACIHFLSGSAALILHSLTTLPLMQHLLVPGSGTWLDKMACLVLLHSITLHNLTDNASSPGLVQIHMMKLCIDTVTIWFCYAHLRQPCIEQCHCIIWFWFTNVHTDTICSPTFPLHDVVYSTPSPGSWFRYSTIMYTCLIRFWCGPNVTLLWTDIKYWLTDRGSNTLPLHDLAYIH